MTTPKTKKRARIQPSGSVKPYVDIGIASNGVVPQSVASFLAANNLNVNALRLYQGQKLGNGLVAHAALLRKDEWEELDTRLVQEARQRLVGIADLNAAGLTMPLGGLGTLVSQFEKVGDLTEADVNMSGATAGNKDTVDFDLVGVPVPIIHKDFEINIRRLLASRRLGDGLDTTQISIATRRVADKLEEILFNGQDITVQGGTIFGYRTHPDRNTGTAVGDFGTIVNIFPTVNNMVIAAEADNYFSPYTLYVSKIQFSEMRAVFNDGSGQSAMVRILENIPTITSIKAADVIPDGELVLVTMLPDVVDLAIAQDITVVQWDQMGGMISQFKVMTAQVPRVKSDRRGRSGIVHFTGA